MLTIACWNVEGGACSIFWVVDMNGDNSIRFVVCECDMLEG